MTESPREKAIVAAAEKYSYSYAFSVAKVMPYSDNLLANARHELVAAMDVIYAQTVLENTQSIRNERDHVCAKLDTAQAANKVLRNMHASQADEIAQLARAADLREATLKLVQDGYDEVEAENKKLQGELLELRAKNMATLKIVQEDHDAIAAENRRMHDELLELRAHKNEASRHTAAPTELKILKTVRNVLSEAIDELDGIV